MNLTMSPNRKNPPKRPAKGPAKRPHRGRPEKRSEKPAEPQIDVEKYETEIKALNDKVLRAMAEMENTRRRAEREVVDARVYAVTGFARDMLTVSDNFHRALSALPPELRENESLKPFIEGVEMTGRELLNTLERHGIKRVSPKGEEFDHNLHQAMFEIETSEHAPGTVMEVIQDGYVIRDRLLRPAMVGIAKAPKENPEKEE